MTGWQVAELVNRQVEAGRHAVTFDASSLPNGAYVYRLTAGSFSQTARLVVLK